MSYVLGLDFGGTKLAAGIVDTATGQVIVSGRTHFSFLLLGAEPADVRLSVYTLSGRLILTRTERTLVPGYHQIAWDGRDAEGDELANGVYLFRMNARTAGGESITETGRLVKLRRPRRVEEPLVP